MVNEVSGNKVSFLAYGKYNIVFRNRAADEHLLAVKNTKARAYIQKVANKLKEGDVCTLRLYEVAFRDFLPYLQGYPIDDGWVLQQH